MFDNIKALRLERNQLNQTVATAMISAEEEVMNFRNEVLTDGRVEDWMNDVLKEMRQSNRFITKKAIYDYGKTIRPRTDWILDYQGMVCLASNQVWWTAEVEHVFEKLFNNEKNAMKEYLLQLNQQLDQLVIKVRGELTRNDLAKFKAIATIDVHARDIIEGFVRDSVINVEDFAWESQLRFYWVRDIDNLQVMQCNGVFDYG